MAFRVFLYAVIGLCVVVGIPMPGEAADPQGAQLPSTTDSQALKAALDQANASIAQSDRSFRQKMAEYDDQLRRIDAVLGSATVNQAKANALQEKVQVLESTAKAKEDDRTRQLDARYEAGKQALAKMDESLAVISFMNELTDLTGLITIEASPRSDDDFRNGWDRLAQWGLGVGTVAGGVVALASKNQDVQRIGLGVGATAAATTVLIQAIFGKFGVSQSSAADKLQSKIEALEISRRAFDHFSERSKLIRSFVESNTKFSGELAKFRKTYDEVGVLVVADVAQKKRAVLADLLSILPKFDAAIGEIPQILDSFKASASTLKRYTKVDQVEQRMGALEVKVDGLRAKYNELAAKVLGLSHEIRRTLMPIP
jgi:uncharacterized phage infection (PIP) family protein YhgE